MKHEWAVIAEARRHYSQLASGVRLHGVRPDFLHLVSEQELEEMEAAISRGIIPPDFELKLQRLGRSTLQHAFVEQHCRRFFALLLAAIDGSFKPVSPAEWRRLLQVLAYVRKDEDGIPDYGTQGYLDDQQEVRAAGEELSSVLDSFKRWRLRQEVPKLWAGGARAG